MHVASQEQSPDYTYNFSLCSNHFRPLTRKVLLSNGLSEEYFDQMMALLTCLAENGSLILKELVIETGLPYPTLSNLIDRGEAIGVIERIKSKSDGRARTIQLTQFGENEIMPRIHRARHQADQVLTETLSNDEKNEFIKLILKITNSLKSKSSVDFN
ncbi:MAG: MarR family transcriptional regulator [Verrucomicrobiota bacterium]|nr:MarR family transcriptional regulator [Verrucomicrobiota bacterium]